MKTEPRPYRFLLPKGDQDYGFKPRGGMWSSTLETWATDGWAWWLNAEQLHAWAQTPYVFEPWPSRVFTVDGPDAMQWFLVRALSGCGGDGGLLDDDLTYSVFSRLVTTYTECSVSQPNAKGNRDDGANHRSAIPQQVPRL